jgi:hypothetical protein
MGGVGVIVAGGGATGNEGVGVKVDVGGSGVKVAVVDIGVFVAGGGLIEVGVGSNVGVFVAVGGRATVGVA